MEKFCLSRYSYVVRLDFVESKRATHLLEMREMTPSDYSDTHSSWMRDEGGEKTKREKWFDSLKRRWKWNGIWEWNGMEWNEGRQPKREKIEERRHFVDSLIQLSSSCLKDAFSPFRCCWLLKRDYKLYNPPSSREKKDLPSASACFNFHSRRLFFVLRPPSPETRNFMPLPFSISSPYISFCLTHSFNWER